ncbi:MAG: relaxase/mobilization nuclease domain-containing protein [Sarcina sp.]
MAILKGVGSPSTLKKGSKSLLKYVGDKATLCKGLNCSDTWQNAFEDFQNTKEFYNKENGRQYLHYVQSFKEGEVDVKQALELTEKFCNKVMKDNEVFLAVHSDQKHIHCHIVVNSVSFVDGYKFQCSRQDLEKWKEISNEINKEYGLNIPQKTTDKNKVISWNMNQYLSIKKGIENQKESDSLNLVKTIMDVSKKSSNKESFITQMNAKGYLTDWQDNKKHIVFTVTDEILIGKKNKFRLDTLGKTFNNKILSKEGLENELGKSTKFDIGRREPTTKETTNRLSEYKQETRPRIETDDRTVSKCRNITRESFRESTGFGRVNSLDDKRRERELKKLDERNRKESERKEREKQAELNRKKSREFDKDFDIDF